ncbi:MAG: hypothetical protein V1908_03405 [Candidatus Peregrinibacteria bacterium]
MPSCKQCSTGFEIVDWDRQFYQRMQVPEPTLCPKCRSQRRMAWGNQTNLYKRKCGGTGADIVSAYHPSSPLTVYRQSYWFSDKWDPMQYGRDFDFSRPFFEQWAEFAKNVPRPALHSDFEFDENAEYTNYAGKNKNCYMLFDSDYNWDCYYSMGTNKSRNCMDNYRIKESELCYECVDCVKCYNLHYSQDCTNCSDSAFLKNCIGCKKCFMCSNLKNKEYYIFNKQYDQATFEKLMQSLSSNTSLAKYFKDWSAFKLQFPQRYMRGIQNENVTGDYLVYSKDALECFDSMQLWDCKYFTRAFGSSQNCMDCDECGDGISEFFNTTFCGYNEQRFRCSMFCFSECSQLDYCFYTHYSQNCFGCLGLRHKKYCIFNKQYSVAEYNALLPKIIEHMKKAGEWGEFFHAIYSDFAYNETIAHEYYPMTKSEVESQGWRWREKDKQDYLPATSKTPDDSRVANESICKELFACEKCGRNYKIIDQEFKFYKNNGIAIPQYCFFCRHKARFDLRNLRNLFSRQCMKCTAAVLTTYAPYQPEIVYCEKCYQESLV